MASTGKTVQGVEILRVGEFDAQTGPIEVTEDDLDAIVAAFEATHEVLGVPVRLGHEAQSGDPAQGWLANLRRVGAKLVADLVRMSEEVVAAVKSGRYGPRSAGLRKDAVIDGQTYPLVLDHLALLGAEQPAVPGLNRLEDLLAAPAGRLIHLCAADGKPFPPAEDEDDEDETEDPMESDMEAKLRALLGLDEKGDILATITSLLEARTAATAAVAQLTAAKGETTNLSQRVIELESKLAKHDADALVTEFADRVPPAAKSAALSLAARDPAGARAWFAALPKFVELGERGTSKDGSDFSAIEPTETQIALHKAMRGAYDAGARVDLMRANAKAKGVTLPDNFSALVTRK